MDLKSPSGTPVLQQEELEAAKDRLKQPLTKSPRQGSYSPGTSPSGGSGAGAGAGGRRRRSFTSKPASKSRNEILLDSLPPNSPAQVYRHLLTLEQSLRMQYFVLIQKRRKNFIFFSVICLALVYFAYSVLLHPSIYGIFNLLERVGLIATIIAMGLFSLTGLYAKTFVEYPKFLSGVNKGLRPFNVKVVRVNATWKESLIRIIWNPGYTTTPGRLTKIVLSSRAFTPETIEGWELYRHDYWERERHRKVKKELRLKESKDQLKDLKEKKK